MSIIIPAWNRASTIGDAIRAIGAADVTAVEVVVVDDGSTDRTVDAAEEAGSASGLGGQLTVIRQNNTGPSGARNVGAARARGEWLVFLDSDDLWFPWTLPTLLEALDAMKTANILFLRTVNFHDTVSLDEYGFQPSQIDKYPDFLSAEKGVRASSLKTRFSGGAFAIRRDRFLAAGGFDTGMRASEDTDFFLRINDEGLCAIIRSPAMVAMRKVGGNKLTDDGQNVLAGFKKLMIGEAAGRYTGSARARTSFLGGSAAYAVRAAFRMGHPALAYQTYLQHIGLLVRARRWEWLVKLPLTPILAAISPSNHAFRWRPIKPAETGKPAARGSVEVMAAGMG